MDDEARPIIGSVAWEVPAGLGLKPAKTSGSISTFPGCSDSAGPPDPRSTLLSRGITLVEARLLCSMLLCSSKAVSFDGSAPTVAGSLPFTL